MEQEGDYGIGERLWNKRDYGIGGGLWNKREII